MLDHMLRNGAVSAAAVLLYFIIVNRCARKKLRALPTVCLAVFVFLMVAVFQLAGVSAVNGIRLPGTADGYNLIPFKGLIEIVQDGVKYGEPLFVISNIGGNIVMFAPLGFFLPLLWKAYRKLWKTTLFGFGTTLLIESTQLFIGRGFDVDDLILNTLGAMLGYACYRLVRKIIGAPIRRCALSAKPKSAARRLLPHLCILIPFIISFCFGFYDRAMYMRM